MVKSMFIIIIFYVLLKLMSDITDTTDKTTFTISYGNDTKSFTITAEQRKLIIYTGLAFGVYYLAKHLVKSSLKSIRQNDD